jgi:GAF domain-containing protein
MVDIMNALDMTSPGDEKNIQLVDSPAVDDPSSAVFRELAQLVYSCDDYAEIYQAVCEAATTLVPGCDHASLMLAQGDTMVTAAASDAIAQAVDVLERELGEGPCVDAIRDEAAYISADLAQDASEWPLLTERVLAETPVRGMAGFRMMVDNNKSGALNLMSDTPGALTAHSIDQAIVLASFLSVALMAAARRNDARSLREGLASNREIGKAMGLMMAFHKINDDEAFELLRRTSHDMNLKVREVARQIVEHHNGRDRRPLS